MWEKRQGVVQLWRATRKKRGRGRRRRRRKAWRQRQRLRKEDLPWFSDTAKENLQKNLQKKKKKKKSHRHRHRDTERERIMDDDGFLGFPLILSLSLLLPPLLLCD